MIRFTSTFFESGNGDCETRSWLATDAKTAKKHREAIKLLGLGGAEETIEEQPLFHVAVSNDHKGLRVSKELRTKEEVVAVIASVLGFGHRFPRDLQAELTASMDGDDDEFSFSDGVSDHVSVTRAYRVAGELAAA